VIDVTEIYASRRVESNRLKAVPGKAGAVNATRAPGGLGTALPPAQPIRLSA
jgi:hypothetical protein